MPTPNFDRIDIEISRRIGDTVANAANDGTVLTATERNAYTNKALLKLFNIEWNKAVTKAEKFERPSKYLIRAVPELVERSSLLTLTAGNYLIASPHFDFFTIIDAETDDEKFITVWDTDLYEIARTQRHRHYIATAEKPSVIQLDKLLAFFPLSSTFGFYMTYIKMPMSPTTNGAFLTQGGAVDSPFLPHWNSIIAEIGEQLFRTDSQETT
jgi:hypothetical protein